MAPAHRITIHQTNTESELRAEYDYRELSQSNHKQIEARPSIVLRALSETSQFTSISAYPTTKMGACLVTETVVYEPGFGGPAYVGGGVGYGAGPVMVNDPYMMGGPVMMNDPYMMGGGMGMMPMQQEVIVQENFGVNVII